MIYMIFDLYTTKSENKQFFLHFMYHMKTKVVYGLMTVMHWIVLFIWYVFDLFIKLHFCEFLYDLWCEFLVTYLFIFR